MTKSLKTERVSRVISGSTKSNEKDYDTAKAVTLPAKHKRSWELPDFANDMSKIKEYDSKSWRLMYREVMNWRLYWQFDVNAGPFTEMSINELCELVKRIQHHFVFEKRPMFQTEFMEALSRMRKAPRSLAVLGKVHEDIGDRLRNFNFSDSTPTTTWGIKEVFKALGLGRLENEQQIRRWKTEVMRAWVSKAPIALESDVELEDETVEETLAVLEDTQISVHSGDFNELSTDAFDRLLVKKTVGRRPRFYLNEFVQEGWPGFDNFEERVEAFVKRCFPVTGIDDENLSPLVIDIFRAWIPNAIWIAVCWRGCPSTLREMVDRVLDLRDCPQFSSSNLWRYYGIRPGSGLGLFVFNPTLWPYLDESYKDHLLVNQLPVLVPDFEPELSDDETRYPHYPVEWTVPVEQLVGKNGYREVKKSKKRKRNHERSNIPAKKKKNF